MNTKPYDLVIFDSDGVLVESEALACRIYLTEESHREIFTILSEIAHLHSPALPGTS